MGFGFNKPAEFLPFSMLILWWRPGVGWHRSIGKDKPLDTADHSGKGLGLGGCETEFLVGTAHVRWPGVWLREALQVDGSTTTEWQNNKSNESMTTALKRNHAC